MTIIINTLHGVIGEKHESIIFSVYVKLLLCTKSNGVIIVYWWIPCDHIQVEIGVLQ